MKLSSSTMLRLGILGAAVSLVAATPLVANAAGCCEGAWSNWATVPDGPTKLCDVESISGNLYVEGEAKLYSDFAAGQAEITDTNYGASAQIKADIDFLPGSGRTDGEYGWVDKDGGITPGSPEILLGQVDQIRCKVRMYHNTDCNGGCSQ